MNGAATVEAWSGELGIEHWLEPVSCTGDADFDDVIDGVFEGAEGQGLHLGVGFAASLMRIGTRLALKGNAFGHSVSVSVPHRGLIEVRSFGRANYTLRRRSGSG